MANHTDNKVSISISTETIVKVLLILLALWFIWLIRDIVVLLFIALIVASAFDPTVDYMQRFKIPRALGIILIYIVFLSLLSFVIAGISGPIANEVKTIAEQVPKYYQELNASLNQFQGSSFFTPERAGSLRGGLDDAILNLSRLASGNVMPVVSSIFGGILSVVLVLVITLYFSVHEGAVKQFLAWIVPRGKSEKAVHVMEQIQRKLGLWLRGQVILSTIIFIITYVGLKILGVPYALVLALLAGFLEIIPYLGPILSAIPAVFLTLVGGDPVAGQDLAQLHWFRAILVVGLYVLMQQAENNIIVPKVMSKSIGLNPLVVIISILIGAKVAGVGGALVAVPLATAITVFLEEQGYKSREITA